MARLDGLKSLLLVLSLSGAATAVTLALDASTEHQTIEGFGAHGSMDVWWHNGPFYNDQFLDRVVNDLGLTISREGWDPPDNGFWPKQSSFAQALNQKAIASGVDMRFIFSVWSPPGDLKIGGSAVDGNEATNQLIATPQNYAAYGDWLVQGIESYRGIGIELYGVSISNEPEFSQTGFNSCYYSETSYRDVWRVVGPKIRAASATVKMFGSENMLNRLGAREAYWHNDSIAGQHMGAIAVHGYHDGAHPLPNTTAALAWDKASRMSAAFGVPVWMTETSGYAQTWAGSMSLAEAIYAALKFGKASAWVWWQLGSSAPPNEYELLSNGQPTNHYYASKQYYRYVRPGAVMIDIDDSGDAELFAVAFNHKTERTLTVVLLNVGAALKQVTLTGASLPGSLKRYVSTQSKHCTEESALNPTSSFTVEPNSITTLFGDSYSPVGVRHSPASSGAASPGLHPDRRASAWYSLDGRSVGLDLSAMRRVPHGVLVRRTHGRSGVARVTVR
jgi:O-glycosyl hydrolase